MKRVLLYFYLFLVWTGSPPAGVLQHICYMWKTMTLKQIWSCVKNVLIVLNCLDIFLIDTSSLNTNKTLICYKIVSGLVPTWIICFTPHSAEQQISTGFKVSPVKKSLQLANGQQIGWLTRALNKMEETRVSGPVNS